MTRTEKYKKLRESLRDVDWADWLYNIPQGWEDLALNMFIEIYKLLIENKLNPSVLVIDDLKEKFGELRFYYDFDCDNRDVRRLVDDIADRYAELSAVTCCVCGKPASYYSKGWICPYCKECAERGGDVDVKFERLERSDK